MQIEIKSDSREKGKRTLAYTITNGSESVDFETTILSVDVGGNGLVSVQALTKSGDGKLKVREEYQFSRDSSKATSIKTNNQGKPLLKDGSVAPKRTKAEAKALLLSSSPLYKLLGELIKGLPQNQRAEANAAFDAVIDGDVENLATHYLPDGGEWGVEEVDTLNEGAVIDTIARDSWRKLKRSEIAKESRKAIKNLEPTK